MHDIDTAFFTAIGLLVSLDHDLVAIVGLSLRVSLAAVPLAALLGLPLGAAVAVWRFPGQAAVGVLLNALMGLPPVVVGLVVYLLLSRARATGGVGALVYPNRHGAGPVCTGDTDHCGLHTADCGRFVCRVC